MKKFFLVLACIATLGITKADNDESCTIHNFCFKNGENILFYIYYTLAGVGVHAGTARFTVNLENMGNKPVWHLIGSGESLPSYDWIFKVRDKYESFVDTTTMQPLKFVRSVEEGHYKKFENVSFNKISNTAITNEGVYKVPGCIQDVISQIYYARNINFDKYKPNDVINFDIFLDNEVNHLYMRYMGRETIKSRYGKFRCIKFKPLLLKSSTFQGGEKMTVWVTDDLNRMPIRIETPISVGSVKADMMWYDKLRYPLTSLVGI